MCMASAVLASNNEELYWGKKAFAQSYKNINLSCKNPSQNPSQKTSCNDNVEIQNPNPSLPSESPLQDYVTIDISEYSKTELRELKRRLNVELNVVRETLENIEKETGPKTSKKRGFLPGQKEERKKKRVKTVNSPELDNIVKKTFTKCATMLTRLMKHKHAWVFNKPVDAVALGLHDYFQIIEKPMDLGTVKSKLSKKGYEMPGDFADDVRLVFKNAMKYNPKGQDVYIMADELRGVFEKMFSSVFEKFEGEKRRLLVALGVNNRVAGDKFPGSLIVPKIVEQRTIGDNFHKSFTVPKIVEQKNLGDKFPKALTVPTLLEPQFVKAKEKKVEKRSMSFEEKEKLGNRLQELPPDGMEQMLAIVNCDLDGDDIELDIDTLDNEILWALDRFVNDYKWPVLVEKSPVRDSMPEVSPQVEVMEAMEEDVDIGDDIPPSNYPPLEIEKDSGSSSSGSSSSSSNGSGSVTSSGSSDSDQDSVQSPFVEAQ